MSCKRKHENIICFIKIQELPLASMIPESQTASVPWPAIGLKRDAMQHQVASPNWVVAPPIVKAPYCESPIVPCFWQPVSLVLK